MPKWVIVVKRRGRKENFDERKIYASIYSACMSRYLNEPKCESIAAGITNVIKRWLNNKNVITSNQIRKKVRTELGKKGRDLVYHYDANIPDLSRL